MSDVKSLEELRLQSVKAKVEVEILQAEIRIRALKKMANVLDHAGERDIELFRIVHEMTRTK